EEIHHPGSRFYFFRTHAGAEIDLIVDRGTERVGIEFKAGAAVEPRDSMSLRRGIDDGVIHRGVIAYQGSRRFEAREGVSVIPAEVVLQAPLD
ncbi:MAG: hypothetical protein KGJ72_17065, partial [Gammaproteobacteria bacterium]|nr:hypothetical protein [Gammaproteobacteria bacterium]